jgi:hypothetical protein
MSLRTSVGTLFDCGTLSGKMAAPRIIVVSDTLALLPRVLYMRSQRILAFLPRIRVFYARMRHATRALSDRGERQVTQRQGS